MTDFDGWMDGTLKEMANPELPVGFEGRMRARAVESSAAPCLLAQPNQSLIASLWDGVREAVWPRRLPPLVLASQPVAVTDRLATARDSRSMVWAVLAHAAVVLVIGWVVEARTGVVKMVVPAAEVIALDTPLPKLRPQASAVGGGGGQQGPTPVTQGHLPKFADRQVLPPVPPPLAEPKIAVQPTVEVRSELKMAESTLPNLGMPTSPLVGMSMGGGRGSGFGKGLGDGVGPGVGGDLGGGARRVGGGVVEPQVLFEPEADYSEEARKAKFSGNVLVYLWVDEHGNPSHVRVARGVGLGLDEKAVDAVRQYRFKPAMENGRPVVVEMYVDVEFHIL